MRGKKKISLEIIKNICHNGFPLDLDDHKNKWSCHRSFLYECDRPPEMRVLKLGTDIDLEIKSSGVQLHVRKD